MSRSRTVMSTDDRALLVGLHGTVGAMRFPRTAWNVLSADVVYRIDLDPSLDENVLVVSHAIAYILCVGKDVTFSAFNMFIITMPSYGLLCDLPVSRVRQKTHGGEWQD